MGVITRGIANNVLGTGEIDATDGVSGTLPASKINNTSFSNVTALPALAGTITTVAGDPPAPSEGQVWYNSVAGALKYRGQVGSWASGGTLNAIRAGHQGGGTQTSTIVYGGDSPTNPGNNSVESYDGSSWTSQPGMNTARNQHNGIASSSTSALAYSGDSPSGSNKTETEEWDGSTWTVVPGTVNLGRNKGGDAGTSVSTALYFGGVTLPPASEVVYSNTEEYNGTSWSEVNDMNTARIDVAGAGSQTSAIAFGGYPTYQSPPSRTNISEEYDGTSWTSAGNMPISAAEMSGAGTSSSSALGFGTDTATPVTTVSYDGSAWSSDTNLSSNRHNGEGAGTRTSALFVGGSAPTVTGATEEYTFGETNITISES